MSAGEAPIKQAVKWIDEQLEDDPKADRTRLIDAAGGSLKKARDIVDEELSKVSWLEKGRGRDFYAIGGTWRALARLHMTQTNYPLSVMHNYRINAEDALRFSAVLDHQSQSSLAGIRDISSPTL